jgi:hypothetical protein
MTTSVAGWLTGHMTPGDKVVTYMASSATSSDNDKEFLKRIDDQWKTMLADWYGVVSARSISEKDREWARFKRTYQHPAFRKLLLYMESELLHQKTGRGFLRYYTNAYMHFGQVATSRSEGSHCRIKRDIQSSLGDLLNVVNSIERTITNHHLQIDQALANERIQAPSDL